MASIQLDGILVPSQIANGTFVSPVLGCDNYRELVFGIISPGALSYFVQFSLDNDKTSWFTMMEYQAGAIAGGVSTVASGQALITQPASADINLNQFLSPTFVIGGRWVRVVYTVANTLIQIRYFMKGDN